MTTTNVKNALQHFVTTKESRSITLKGEWGTGKTFIWDQTVKQHRNEFARANYAYISLFGLSNLAELKRAIFTNSVKREHAGKIATKESITENFKKLESSSTPSILRKLTGYANEIKIPYLGGIGGIVDSIQFSTISDTLICIDDFERKSTALSTRDLFGLISNLIESRNCSIILILNQNFLKSNDEFFDFSEKVFDYEVTYSPEIIDSIKIIFPPGIGHPQTLTQHIEKLKINNIRLLKKIALFHDTLSPILSSAPIELYNRSMIILPLAVLSAYGKNTFDIDLEFLRNPLPKTPLFQNRNEITEQQKNDLAKVEYLNDYGFSGANDLDIAIISLIEKGYADKEQIQIVLKTLADTIQHNKDMSLLQAAWSEYQSSFVNNQDEIVDIFERALSICLHKMKIREVDSVCWLFSELGMHERVNEIIEAHFETAKANCLYRDSSHFRLDPEHPQLLARLKSFINNQEDDMTMASMMDMAYGYGGFGRKVMSGLHKKSTNDFYNYFTSSTNEHVQQHAENCLEISNTTFSDNFSNECAQHIFLCTYEAIQKISKESKLNEIRTQRFKKYEAYYLEIKTLGKAQDS